MFRELTKIQAPNLDWQIECESNGEKGGGVSFSRISLARGGGCDDKTQDASPFYQTTWGVGFLGMVLDCPAMYFGPITETLFVEMLPGLSEPMATLLG